MKTFFHTKTQCFIGTSLRRVNHIDYSATLVELTNEIWCFSKSWTVEVCQIRRGGYCEFHRESRYSVVYAFCFFYIGQSFEFLANIDSLISKAYYDDDWFIVFTFDHLLDMYPSRNNQYRLIDKSNILVCYQHSIQQKEKH